MFWAVMVRTPSRGGGGRGLSPGVCSVVGFCPGRIVSRGHLLESVNSVLEIVIVLNLVVVQICGPVTLLFKNIF